ncbi:MAG: hypothetical protein HRU19_15015 [Pseudobacteriovorax sp.]|nr:hypothetical protein [Pseudobacteriovorax sp.]
MSLICYRRLYSQSVARADRLVLRLNHLNNLVPYIKRDETLTSYQNAIDLMETFLTAVNRLPPLSAREEIVRAMEPMLLEIEMKINGCIDDFEKEVDGTKELGTLLKPLKGPLCPVTGCFFCSKPYSPRTFRETTVSFDAETKTVYGCASCRALLKSKKQVEVLHFMRNGKNVHWSELSSYDPRSDYYKLGARRSVWRRMQISLVKDEE